MLSLLWHEDVFFPIRILFFVTTMLSWQCGCLHLSQTDFIVTIQSWADRFGQWYSTIFEGRRVRWLYSVGEVVVTGTYSADRKFEFVLSPVQTAALLAFSSRSEALSFLEIQQHSGVRSTDDLKKILHSLCMQKDLAIVKVDGGQQCLQID